MNCKALSIFRYYVIFTRLSIFVKLYYHLTEGEGCGIRSCSYITSLVPGNPDMKTRIEGMTYDLKRNTLNVAG